MTDWIVRWFELAEHISTWSKDPRTKVGAVLVGADRREIAVGFNGFPRGVEDTEERLNNRSVKNALTQHAERNVLDNARFDAKGGTLVVTFAPCHECAKSIIAKGVARVICPPSSQDPKWLESFALSSELFDEAGVELLIFSK